MKLFRIAVLALLGALVLAFVAFGLPESAESAADAAEQGITVSGLGTVEAVPDEARFSFAVTTRGPTAKAASTANAALMQKVIAALRAAGVPEADIRTEQVTVYGRESFEDGEPQGHQAQNSVSVKLPTAGAGKVVDAAVAAGATDVSGPMFDRSDREVLYRQALGKAVEAARVKADAIGEAANVSVGDVTRVVEGGTSDEPVMYEAMAAPKAAADTPVEPGTEEIQATVTVTFAVG